MHCIIAIGLKSRYSPRVVLKIHENYKKVSRLLHYLFVILPFEQNERRFIRHNRKVWPPVEGAKSEILVEIFPVASSIVSQSYLANCLAQKHHASITAYTPASPSFLRRIYNIRFHRLYRSFQTRKFLYIDSTATMLLAAEKQANEILAQLSSKRDVEDLVVEGVYVGDLLYDSHLKKYQVPTIDIASKDFKASLIDMLVHFQFWKNYLNSHAVSAILVSHCVYYENAIILRLGLKKGIAGYQVSATHCYRMNDRHLLAYNSHEYYPEEFRRLSPSIQQEGLAQAKARLELRFSGQVGVDMHYSTKSAYGGISDKPLLRKSAKTKVLVATHCFFDSPHSYGNNLFTDFYEWLEFLGNISNRTDYDWYIKTHPDILPGNIPIIEAFIKKFPKFTLLPRNSSHMQIIREGINVALTVYGTIGMEYAALGVPVVHASLANPHVAYDFNLHVGKVEQYEKILLDLGNLKLKIDSNKVYEYYFIRHIHKAENWLFTDYEKFIADIGGYIKQLQPITYSYFLNELTPQRHLQICDSLHHFIESEDYYMRKDHLSKLSS